MSKFRKKPVVIEALHLTEEVFWESQKDGGFGRLPEPFNKFCFSGSHNPVYKTIGTVFISIPTLEGTMRADLGDWIIRGIKGEFYPCKPDIFEKTYEPESAKPPASEGVREALERVEKCYEEAMIILKEVETQNFGNVKICDRSVLMIALITNKLLVVREALAALPELEKRECLACGGGEFKNITAHCKQCNGTGEVWVRKAGV